MEVSWIDDILAEKGKDEKRQNEDNPSNSTSTEDIRVVDDNITGAQNEDTEEIPRAF